MLIAVIYLIERIVINEMLNFLIRRKKNEEERLTLKSLVGKISDKLGKKMEAKEASKRSSTAQYIDPKLDQLKQTDVNYFPFEYFHRIFFVYCFIVI